MQNKSHSLLSWRKWLKYIYAAVCHLNRSLSVEAASPCRLGWSKGHIWKRCHYYLLGAVSFKEVQWIWNMNVFLEDLSGWSFTSCLASEYMVGKTWVEGCILLAAEAAQHECGGNFGCETHCKEELTFTHTQKKSGRLLNHFYVSVSQLGDYLVFKWHKC